MIKCQKCKQNFDCESYLAEERKSYLTGKAAKPYPLCPLCTKIERFLELLSQATKETGIYLTSSRVYRDDFDYGKGCMGAQIDVETVPKRLDGKPVKYTIKEPIWENVQLTIGGKEIK